MYRLFIWLIAAVFAFNGATSLAWVDVPVTSIAGGHQVAAVAAGYDTQSHRVDGDSGAAATNHDQTSRHADDCLKCCGTCSFVSVIPNVVVTAVTFSSTAVKFEMLRDDLVGRVVALDPDIPKTLI